MTRTALDLYAGAGGATEGLRSAGFDVVGAIENDPDAAASYRLNHPDVRLWDADIRKVPASHVLRALDLKPGDLTLLKACPPCQGFSSMAEGRVTVNEEQNDLVLHTIRFVRALRPQSVLLENVPGLGRDARARRLVGALTDLGYASKQYKVNAVEFGVPQRRKRLIILAARGLRSRLPESLSSVGLDGDLAPDLSVRTAFQQLADELVPGDPLDRSRRLSETVARRVEAVPIGGSRFDLPRELQLDCHVRLGARSRSAASSYGRLRLDQPAPTMTTRCTTPACGSFIHPTENRGITLREAATLQTFPATYQFAGGYGAIERQIGNAVPVRMAKALGGVVLSLVGQHRP
ncbi:DNA cytosine methyltransferase [Nocardioides sp. NPDC006273]|uniref:DNA cytosine methyltransferase n=1 Tax=Nocardioides sp. NPDC006273 TaxID=3155598 RepID=UPI0033A88D75